MAKYTLLPIPLKQSFANSGIKQRVPYQLPAADDDLNWLEGFTDAYQRPVIPDNFGEKSGRYVRMGQINQILENVSQAILNVKQSLDNVSETIDEGIKIEIDKVVTNANNALANKKVSWLQTLGNQNCAGLKDFRDININNFKNSPQAVANLEWCNGVPIQTKNYYNVIQSENFTITISNGVLNCKPPYPNFLECIALFLNNKSIGLLDALSYSYNRVFLNGIPIRRGDVYSIKGTGNCKWGHVGQVYLGS